MHSQLRHLPTDQQPRLPAHQQAGPVTGHQPGPFTHLQPGPFTHLQPERPAHQQHVPSISSAHPHAHSLSVPPTQEQDGPQTNTLPKPFTNRLPQPPTNTLPKHPTNTLPGRTTNTNTLPGPPTNTLSEALANTLLQTPTASSDVDSLPVQTSLAVKGSTIGSPSHDLALVFPVSAANLPGSSLEPNINTTTARPDSQSCQGNPSTQMPHVHLTNKETELLHPSNSKQRGNLSMDVETRSHTNSDSVPVFEKFGNHAVQQGKDEPNQEGCDCEQQCHHLNRASDVDHEYHPPEDNNSKRSQSLQQEKKKSEKEEQQGKQLKLQNSPDVIKKDSHQSRETPAESSTSSCESDESVNLHRNTSISRLMHASPGSGDAEKALSYTEQKTNDIRLATQQSTSGNSMDKESDPLSMTTTRQIPLGQENGNGLLATKELLEGKPAACSSKLLVR